MEQYKSEGQQDTPVQPNKVSNESKHSHSIESLVKQLQDNVGIQQQEIMRLRRDITRLKNDINDIVNVIKNHG